MLGSFLLILRHLLLDHPGIDPVATHLSSVRSSCSSHSRPRYHSSNRPGVELSHSDSRHLRMWKQPVNDSRSVSRPTVAAASNIAPASRNGPATASRPPGSPPPGSRSASGRLGRPRRVLDGHQLVIDQLLLPSLMIEYDQFSGRTGFLVEPRRHQGVDRGVPDPCGSSSVSGSPAARSRLDHSANLERP